MGDNSDKTKMVLKSCNAQVSVMNERTSQKQYAPTFSKLGA